MDRLSSNVWLAITNTIFSIHSAQNTRQMAEIVLNELNWFVPYDRAMFFYKDSIKNEELSEPVIVNLDEHYVNRYMDGSSRYDSTMGLKFGGTSFAFRESDMIDPAIWKQTCFYREFCEPNNIEYILQIVLCYNNECVGNVFLFRNNNTVNAVDFSEKDFFIINLLKDHLSLGLYRILCEKQSFKRHAKIIKKTSKDFANKNMLSEYLKKYHLTERETEILHLILDGNSTEKICDILSIAPNTLKKHTFNMYRKLGVNSRTELFKIIRLTMELDRDVIA